MHLTSATSGRLALALLVAFLAVAVQASAADAAPVNLEQGKNYGAGDLPYSVETADLNSDGVLDILTPNTLSDNLSVRLGRGDGTFEAPATFPAGVQPRVVVTGDFDKDGREDAALTNVKTDQVSVLKGDGRGGFSSPASYPVGDQPRTLVARDFDRDGDRDLAVVNRRDDTVSILLGRGDGSFAPTATYQAGDRPGSGLEGDGYDLDSDDFDRDGKLDLAVANRESNNVSLLLGGGDGTFRAGANYQVGKMPFDVTVGDFNGDRMPDLAAGNVKSKDVSILLGTGRGTFTGGTRQGIGVAAFSLAVADFNVDGKADLAAANNTDTTYIDNKEYAGSAAILLGKGDGSFRVPRDYPVGARPVAISGDDFDADGKPDLATANRESDDISVLLRSDTNLGLTATPSVVTWPATATLRGWLASAEAVPLTGRRVVLYRRPWVRSAFERVPGQPEEGVAVAADGTFSLAGVRPEWTTDYQARFSGDTAGNDPVASSMSLVQQKVRVTLNVQERTMRLGRSRTISGSVSHPSHADLPVTVVVRRNGVVLERRKLTLLAGEQDSKVDYGFAYRPPRPGIYRFVARFDGHPPGHLGNRSPVKGFRVVR